MDLREAFEQWVRELKAPESAKKALWAKVKRLHLTAEDLQRDLDAKKARLKVNPSSTKD